MYAIKAVYDGVNFIPLEPIPVTEPHEVIITFLEPIEQEAKGDSGVAL